MFHYKSIPQKWLWFKQNVLSFQILKFFQWVVLQLSRVLHYKQEFWEELIAYFIWNDMSHLINNILNNSCMFVFVFTAVVMLLTSLCLAKIEGYISRHTNWPEGLMKYTTEMVLGAMIYLQSIIKIGSAIWSWWEGHTDKQTWWSHKHMYISLNK